MAWMRGLRRSSWPDEVTRVLAEVELVDRRRDRFAALSGGMVQRVNLAQALLGDPDLLLLDEPLSGLDPEQRIRIRQLVARIGQRHAVLVSTHVMDDVVPVATRVLMLDGGGLAFDGPPAELAAIGERSVTADSAISPYEAAFLALRNGDPR
ncbi:ATP-binding cassette domain-containing protein [Marmoricola sp. RAF53]|uniref:ATP-binding cassette domain-containing protein n=1 Tax=Marmoricola sp. RAF53 TaxID=3233059 RepID=UPI003F974AAE